MAIRNAFLTALLILALPFGAYAAAPPADRPHWSLEVKGGWFYPDIDTWEINYGRDRTWHYAGSLAYKLFRQMDIGVDGGFIKDRGQGNGAISGMVTGRVIYEVFPVQAFVLLRGVFSERQWIVPYAGGGWTRMYYREQTEAQGTARGYADGYHGRAGLQFLLDNIDPRAAHNLHADFGILHTYLFGEVQVTNVQVGTPSVNLGGRSYLAGFLFEF